MPDTPTPCSPVLETAYYPSSKDLVAAVKKLLSKKVDGNKGEKSGGLGPASDKQFTGPF